MDSLRTARVLLVDDDRDEAEPMLKALGKVGVGALYFSGSDERELPDDPLFGIRLAALDMHIAPGGGGDAQARLSPLLGVLDRVIASGNGPYIVLAWTEFPEDVEDFRRMAADLACPPVAVTALSKSDAKDASGAFDLAKIQQGLEGALRDSEPLELVNVWDQLLHDAATNAVNDLSGSSADWVGEATSTLAALLRESADVASDEEGDLLRGLFDALNPLLFDHVEAGVIGVMDAVGPSLAAVKGAVGIDGVLGPYEVNRRLLLGSPHVRVAPGNLYLLTEAEAALHSELRRVLPQPADLQKAVRGTYRGKGESAFAELESDQAPLHSVLMEVSPLCDFQAGKRASARFLAGLAVPVSAISDEDKVAGLSSPDPIAGRAFPPVEVDHSVISGPHVFAFHARFLVTLPVDDLATCDAVARLRREPLVDLQSWLASHASRPGFLALR